MPVREAVTVTGERIGYDMCFAPQCLQPAARCCCEDGPAPPRLGPHAGYVVVDRRAPARPAA